MKKIIGIILMMLIIVAPIQILASSNDVVYAMDYWYNNNAIMEDGAIINQDGKVMVPVKVFADSVGATSSLDKSQMTYTVTRGNVELVFNLNDNTVKVNGKYVWANAPTKIIGQRIYAPATFMANKFGMKAYINYAKNRYEVYPTGTNGAVGVNVQSGDTLSKLSSWYDVSVDWIKNQNGLLSNMIYPGQTLIMGYYNQNYSYNLNSRNIL